jgi:hypothetical protein
VVAEFISPITVRAVLGHQRHYPLRLDRPVLNSVNDLLVDLGRRCPLLGFVLRRGQRCSHGYQSADSAPQRIAPPRTDQRRALRHASSHQRVVPVVGGVTTVVVVETTGVAVVGFGVWNGIRFV